MTTFQYTTSHVYDVASTTSLDINATDANSMSLLTTMAPSQYGRFGALEQFRTFWAAFYINKFYLWVICAVGIPGNMASFVTVLRMPPLTTSTGYVAALAVVDTMAIISKLLFHQFTLYDVPIKAEGCQLLFFFGSFFTMYANWILVTMSVERFIAIWFPLKVTTLVSKKKSVGIMVAIAIIIISADLHFLWTATIINDDLSNMDCGFKEEHSEFIKYIWYWIDGSLYAIFPCIFLVLFNVLIIIGIRRSRRIQRDLTNNKNDQMAEKYRQQRQITIMLIVVSVVFVVLVLPNCIFFIVKSYWTYDSASYGHALYIFTSQLIFVLSDINHAINFYLYFLTARRFRRKFTDTLCCRTSSRRAFTSTMRTANSNVSNTSIYTTQTSMNGSHRDGGNNNSRKYTTTAT